jgi:hypothetical protein
MQIFTNETKTHCFAGNITIEDIFEALYVGQMMGWYMIPDTVQLTEDRELKVTCVKRTEITPTEVENGTL